MIDLRSPYGLALMRTFKHEGWVTRMFHRAIGNQSVTLRERMQLQHSTFCINCELLLEWWDNGEQLWQIYIPATPSWTEAYRGLSTAIRDRQLALVLESDRGV